MTVDILMATYNGANFIENQILSLLGQTFKNWQLIIHDDGSTDNTLEIVNKYIDIDSRIILITDGIKCGGAAKNFLHLLKFSTSEYIIFCDQDDVWFESKLKVLYEIICKESVPAAVYCNAYTYDGEKITSYNVTQFHRNALENSLFLNSGVQGCSLMFNKNLLSIIIDFPKFVHMHDHLITIAAVSFGKLLHTDSSLMLYRQHKHNVTGNVSTHFSEKMKHFFNFNNPVIDQLHFDANKSFFYQYKNLLNVKQIKIFEAYFSYSSSMLMKRIVILLSNSFCIGKSSISLIIKTIIRKPI